MDGVGVVEWIWPVTLRADFFKRTQYEAVSQDSEQIQDSEDPPRVQDGRPPLGVQDRADGPVQKTGRGHCTEPGAQRINGANMFDFKAIQKLMPNPAKVTVKLKMKAAESQPDLAALTRKAIKNQD